MRVVEMSSPTPVQLDGRLCSGEPISFRCRHGCCELYIGELHQPTDFCEWHGWTWHGEEAGWRDEGAGYIGPDEAEAVLLRLLSRFRDGEPSDGTRGAAFGGLEDEGRLSGDQRAFLDESRRMVGHLGVAALRHLQTSARLERFRGSHQLVLALRSTGAGTTVEASVSADEIIIDMSQPDRWSYHWHVAPTGNDVYGGVPGRSWISLAVDFVADLLLGEVRVSTTYRGDHLVKVRAQLISAEGEPVAAGTAGFLGRGVLSLWSERHHDESTVRLLPRS